MDLVTSWPAFVVAIVLISASPGPAMALIVRRAALRGFAGAVPTVLGLELGIYLWALLAAAGFAALVEASETAYVTLKVVGAGFLVYLGARSLLAAWRERRSLTDLKTPAAALSPATLRTRWVAFGEGAVVQLANPKAAVFLLALYPQFIPADRPLFATTALVAVVQVTIETGLYLALAAGVGRAGTWFQRPRVRARFEAVSGTVLVALGLRVAVDRA